MESQFRPYGLVVSLDETHASSVTLRDTSGSPLQCNFISVEASGENPDAFYRVAYTPTSSVTPLENFVATSATIGTTSGIVGGYSTVNKGVVEFLLADAERTDTIQLQLDENGACKFFITYGQVQGGSIRRDNERPIGS